jgi:hypothetical protein
LAEKPYDDTALRDRLDADDAYLRSIKNAIMRLAVEQPPKGVRGPIGPAGPRGPGPPGKSQTLNPKPQCGSAGLSGLEDPGKVRGTQYYSTL